MKKKIILMLVRIARFFRKEELLAPELSSVAERHIRIGRIYSHYGRILLTRRNPQQVQEKFYIFNTEISQQVFENKKKEFSNSGFNPDMRCEYTGQACHLCACELYGLPCRCDFRSGPFTGYYELVHTRHQHATQPLKPLKQPLI